MEMKLCVLCGSIFSRQLIRHFPTVMIWWATTVEIESALARLKKQARITEEEEQKLRLDLSSLKSRWFEIPPEDDVRELANTCLQQYRLQAADAFQLAAALIWCNERPRGRALLFALMLIWQTQRDRRGSGFTPKFFLWLRRRSAQCAAEFCSKAKFPIPPPRSCSEEFSLHRSIVHVSA
jgi:hypothetical protein